MLTPEIRSEICGINQAFAVQFARELAIRPGGQWFDPVVVSDAQKERKYEALAPYQARQKERTLAHETELRGPRNSVPSRSRHQARSADRRVEPRRRSEFPKLFFGWIGRTSSNGTQNRRKRSNTPFRTSVSGEPTNPPSRKSKKKVIVFWSPGDVFHGLCSSVPSSLSLQARRAGPRRKRDGSDIQIIAPPAGLASLSISDLSSFSASRFSPLEHIFTAIWTVL